MARQLETAAPLVPERPALPRLREAAAACRACPLWQTGTQRSGLSRRDAAQTLLGRDFRVTQRRGELVETELAPNALATVHPSSILRADDDTRDAKYAALVDDLRIAAGLLD